MHQKLALLPAKEIVYPDSDGKPMSDNTRQGWWIVLLFSNLCSLFRDQANVFIAHNLLWYTVEGEPEIRAAPDVLVVFGRPKGHRGSYKQWEEDNVPLTVVFEILSPSNTPDEMDEKWDFYEEHGVEEYYVYNPETNRLSGFVRHGTAFLKVRPIHNHVSPRLGIRFDLSGSELVIFDPKGKRFLMLEEMAALWEEDQRQKEQARRETEQARQHIARLAELSRKARQGQATPEDLQELDRLAQESSPGSR